MKYKIAIAGVLFSLSTVASALELGVIGSYDYSLDTNRGAAGVTVGEKFGPFGLTAGFEQYTKNENQNKFSLVGSVDVTKVLGTTLAVKAGGVYMNNSTSPDGYAFVAGVGTSYPLTKQIDFTVDYRYQVGQDRVEQFDGSTASVGFKYSF